MVHGWWHIGPALSVLILGGCVHVKLEESRDSVANVGVGDSIVLLAKPQPQGVNSEFAFLDCLEEQLLGHSLPKDVATAEAASLQGVSFRLVPHQPFVNSLYPWLEASTVTADDDFVRALLSRPGVKERIRRAGVKYLVSVEGLTSVTDRSGSISCVVGPGAGGCFGLAFWKKQSGYEASVWDLEKGTSVGTVGTDVSGKSVFIGAIVPLPFVAPVQHTACKQMAAQLAKFLVGEGQ